MYSPQDPVVVTDNDGPQVREIREQCKPQGLEPYWPLRGEKADRLASGQRIANLPGTRREIHPANHVLTLVVSVRSDNTPGSSRALPLRAGW
jgi:hypothetical protein